ncbi:magnesium transporter MgtE N-terminal domain-containing protein [Candidatus Nitrospira allomarina]|jgi:magnesium transporter|uniref:CBS domain-containing protein n=1 Tax=Candidatus Nitrospira allomarina TaxID=3020900 RepID=A0AA96G9J2_9BACT|nr:CBS domain-containing protein [Candidatus Nitrospira allomarina]WNM56917.1 CBS domain-containing protein [Candidatus Nitrospira allomarina]
MELEHRLTLGYLQAHPVEAARHLESLDPHEAASLLEALPGEEIAGVLEHCLPVSTAKIIEELSKDLGANVLGAMNATSAIGVLRQFEEPVRQDVLDRLDNPMGATLRRALRYSPNTAGSLADPQVFTLPPDIAVEEAIDRIRTYGQKAMYYIYVIDRDSKLEGVITLRQLLIDRSDHLVGTLMETQITTLSAEANLEEILKHSEWSRFHTLPVVDRWGTFFGALRYRMLRRIEKDVGGKAPLGSVSDSLMQLWEVYSLTGIRLMTDVAETLQERNKIG